MHLTTIGLDLAKHWFQIHGIDAAGRVAVRRRLRRPEVVEFFRRRCRGGQFPEDAANSLLDLINSLFGAN